jgi:hypothetical protein
MISRTVRAAKGRPLWGERGRPVYPRGIGITRTSRARAPFDVRSRHRRCQGVKPSVATVSAVCGLNRGLALAMARKPACKAVVMRRVYPHSMLRRRVDGVSRAHPVPAAFLVVARRAPPLFPLPFLLRGPSPDAVRTQGRGSLRVAHPWRGRSFPRTPTPWIRFEPPPGIKSRIGRAAQCLSFVVIPGGVVNLPSRRIFPNHFENVGGIGGNSKIQNSPNTRRSTGWPAYQKTTKRHGPSRSLGATVS